tara:strand:- start:702 stop:1565 length:864 start_codon:yes stop_codon:yes gene_type:complete
MKLGEALSSVSEQLVGIGSYDARIEAEVILRHVLGIDRASMFRDLQESLILEQEDLVTTLVKRRLEGEPLSYITGTREFYSLSFEITEDVLIPRQETELLVEAVIEFSKKRDWVPLNIADVGTGSGAIAVAIAVNIPFARVTAIDISQKALKVADVNRRTHGVHDRVLLRLGNLLEPLSGEMNIIVSNPPYIPEGDIDGLQREVLREPRVALDGGPDGLTVIRNLLRQSKPKLSSLGMVVFEIDPTQARKASQLSKKMFPDASITVLEDLSGKHRAILIDTSVGTKV